MSLVAVMQRGWSLQKAAVTGAAVWLVVAVLSLLLASGELQTGLLVGTVAGGLGGLLGFLLLSRMRGRPMKAALNAVLVGFVGRGALVVVGLLLTLRAFEGNPFGFVGAFFVLFFVFVALEGLVLAGGSHGDRVR